MKPSVRRSVQRFGLAAAGVAVLALTSGCGVSAAELRPGTAAQVGGTSISISDVDDATTAYCDYVATQPSSQVLVRSDARTQLLEGLVLRAAADGLIADDHLGLTPGTSYDQALEQAQTTLAGLPTDQRDHLLDAYTGFDYFIDLATQIGGGAHDGDADRATSAKHLTAGVTEVQDWVKTHPIETDASFPSLTIGDAGFETTPGIGTVSVPVSSAAKLALAAAVPTPAADAQAYIASLPANQTCG